MIDSANSTIIRHKKGNIKIIETSKWKKKIPMFSLGNSPLASAKEITNI